MVAGVEVVEAGGEVRDLVARYVFYDILPIRSGPHLGLPGCTASITISLDEPIVRLDPISGAPIDCTTLETSTTTGLELVGATAFYGSTVGDILTGLTIVCQ